jgi:hypothetical protein
MSSSTSCPPAAMKRPSPTVENPHFQRNDLPGDGDGSDLDGRINQLPTPVRTESLVVLRGARAAGFAVGEEFIHICPRDRPQ